MTTTGIFTFDDDQEDIVTLRPERDGLTASGWVNVGAHAIEITLSPSGDLQIQSYAKGSEFAILGSVHVPRMTAMLAERPGDQNPVDGLLADLRGIGFGTDGDINGGDCVNTVSRHFGQLCELANVAEVPE